MYCDNNNNSVLTLVNKLCHKFAAQKCRGGSCFSDHSIFEKKFKNIFFEIIFSKAKLNTEPAEPIEQLLTYYFIKINNKKNVVESDNVKKLKELIDHIMDHQKKDDPTLRDALRLLICLKDSVVWHNNQELYENPFTFGKMEEMLPRPCVEPFGSSCPYPYFPSDLFEHPNKNQALLRDESISNNFLHNHDTFSENENLNRINSANSHFIRELRGYGTAQNHIPFFYLPIAGIDSSCNESFITIQRLTRPRDLLIPKLEDGDHIKKTFFTHKETETEKIPKHGKIPIGREIKSSSQVWEIARTLDTESLHYLWELAAKQPEVHERRLISMAPLQVVLWKEKYPSRLHDFVVTSERKFIRHLMYLLIGIESSSFYLNKNDVFVMRPGLVLEGISSENVQNYVSNLLIVGTCYRRLNNFASGTLNSDSDTTGFIYKVCENNVRRFLVRFRVRAISIFGEGETGAPAHEASEPTLLQIVQHIRPLKQEIETVAAIHRVIDADPEESFPRGAGLMAYLYREITTVTHVGVARILYTFLKSVCQVYFKFIERFIFEGELEDPHLEFFIQKEPAFARVLSKRYWDRGFCIRDCDLVPTFLKGLAKDILLCGKSLRLLKQCNPNDPLCVLLWGAGAAVPGVRACVSFGDVRQMQRTLARFRTRCRFVCGEPVTFAALAVREEDARRASKERAAAKQAETHHRIVADRKRLARLIAEEKRNSLRILEAALAADKLRKRRRGPLDATDATHAAHALDSRIKNQEEKKILEYYSKLNEQVEFRKQHSEWKLKRLQLHESRVQMLSSEERNLRCQKLQLQNYNTDRETVTVEHSKERMCNRSDNGDIDSEYEETLLTDVDMECLNSDCVTDEPNPTMNNHESENPTKQSSSNKIFNVIFTAAKNIFSHKDFESETRQIDRIIDINENPVDEYSVANCVNRANVPDLNSNNCTQSITADREIQLAAPSDEDNANVHTRKPEAFDTNKERNVGSSVVFTPNENEDNLQSRAPVTVADKEALINKKKVLLNEFNEPTKTRVHTWEPEEFDTNKERNEFSSVSFTVNRNENLLKHKVPVTEAQREAIENKRKVLSNEFNTPTNGDIFHSLTRKVEEFDANKERNEVSCVQFGSGTGETQMKHDEPVTDAQRRAVKNKEKILGSEYGIRLENVAKQNNRKHTLTLDLKTESVGSGTKDWRNTDAPADPDITSVYTPATSTPGHLATLLDLETPTCDIIPATSATEEPSRSHVDLHDGFTFPGIIVEEDLDDVADEYEDTVQNDEDIGIQTIRETEIQSSNLLKREGYCFDDFDPFGVRGASLHSTDHFSERISATAKNLLYGNGEDIVKAARSKPMRDIFTGTGVAEEEVSDSESVDLMTLRTCLQRSVMLPLSYQLEMVNNSILTYFLSTLDLYEHLKSLKDYFFLMDGEFSRSICNSLFQKLASVSRPDELLNFATLNNLLNKAFSSSIKSCSKYSENLCFTLTELPLSFQHSSPDVLQCTSLSYSVAWPLNIILSNEALERYSAVFNFLLKLRRISWILRQDFEMLQALYKRCGGALSSSPQYRSVQVFRHCLSSLTHALDAYLVSSCLLAAWTDLDLALKRARTLEDLYQYHVAYVKQIMFRCLLNKRSAPVMALLHDIFTVILRFHQVLNAELWQVDSGTGLYHHPSFDTLRELFELLDKLSRRLHKTVVRLMDCGYQPHLAQLITAINLNDFYHEHKLR